MKQNNYISDSLHTHDELVDLVDEHDQVIKAITRSELFARKTNCFRVATTFVVNQEGLLWVPKSSENKKRFALHWGMVGGCVHAGESYENAFKREVKEEINIDVDQVSHRLLGYFTPYNDGSAAFKQVYEIVLEDVKTFDAHEFCASQWMQPQELMQRIEAGEKALPDVPMLLKKFYLNVPAFTPAESAEVS